MVMVGGGSQQLLSLDPTTFLVVLLLGLWLLFGCDNKIEKSLESDYNHNSFLFRFDSECSLNLQICLVKLNLITYPVVRK